MTGPVTDRAWQIARKHVPYFETCFEPNRAAILSAVTEALETSAPPSPELDALLTDIDRADAGQGVAMPETAIDPATGRPLGDHGTANDAINFVLDTQMAWTMETEFLKAWREGDLAEWPDFYEWLAAQERSAAA